jgi:LAO/AO transport system kinase
VNKSDLPNADLFYRQLTAIYESFRPDGRASARGARDGWHVPILKTSGAEQDGIDALVDALDQHRAHIAQGGQRDAHRREQARHQVLALARQRLIDRLVAEHASDGRLDDIVARVAARTLDPHSAADELTN